MASIGVKCFKTKLVAKLVTENRQPCVFCEQDVDDEVIYGKLYALGDIQCHYFCVLLSCCLIQKGKDTEGLFGFMYKDILAEVERSKKHKCSYCGRGGASLGCSVSQCRKQFHLPCGRRKNAISLFYGNYKSFCELHAPKQKIADDVMANAKVRMKRDRMIKGAKKPVANKEKKETIVLENEESSTVCVICYEEVQGYPTTQTFWPPCCGRDAWLHRSCLQRMALSAGMHYIKCPLCNDKEQFYEAVCDQGYYLPDRDAAWELEQNAFAEIYERPTQCAAVECKCPFGRSHDELGIWDIKLCLLCGSWGMHAHCLSGERAVCATCRPAALDLDRLETQLAHLIRAEQEKEAARSSRQGPIMPSRMSLRRTKGRAAFSAPSSSQNLPAIMPKKENNNENQSPKTESSSRQELNLKTPKRPVKFLEPSVLKDLENKLLSPIKMLEQSYLEKVGGMEDVVVNSNELIERMRAKFNKPKPLSEKKRIVNEILEDLFNNVYKENLKSKEPVKEWNSPKKTFDVVNILKENSILTAKVTDHEEFEEKVQQNRALEDYTANDTETDPADDDGAKIDSKDDPQVDDKTPNDNTQSDDDESSNSTFVLPPELVADSEDSLQILDTPKKLKTVDIEHNSSLEISEHDEVVNIDMVEIGNGKEGEFIKNLKLKSPVKSKMCSLKFSPLDKEALETENVDIDMESFKNQYLNEVEPKFKCNFNHKHEERRGRIKRSSVIDFAIDATNRKRKLGERGSGGKRRKNTDNNNEIKNKRKRIKNKMVQNRARDGKIRLKIKLKSKNKVEQGDTTKRKKLKKLKAKIVKNTFKQYVLQYSKVESNAVIAKPEVEITPAKRKYVKTLKSPDNLVQTTIQSFFKVK